MKTEFEELWSKINYTMNYDRHEIKLWYLDKMKLNKFFIPEIHNKEGRGFWVAKMNEKGYNDTVYIPENNILVVTYFDKIIFDRRYSYTGKHNTDLPPEYDLYIPDECGDKHCKDMTCDWHYGKPIIGRQ